MSVVSNEGLALVKSPNDLACHKATIMTYHNHWYEEWVTSKQKVIFLSAPLLKRYCKLAVTVLLFLIKILSTSLSLGTISIILFMMVLAFLKEPKLCLSVIHLFEVYNFKHTKAFWNIPQTTRSWARMYSIKIPILTLGANSLFLCVYFRLLVSLGQN